MTAAHLQLYEERATNLKRANRTRTFRAQLKRDLQSRRRTVSGYLIAPPEYLETMKVFDLLLAVPNYGKVRAGRTLGLMHVSQAKTIGGLTDRQRRELAEWLR